jgi:hypothetical protein
MKLQLVIYFVFMLFAHASTFVGNGGSQGDIELAASKKQLVETFQAIIENKQSDYLCKCTEDYENRDVCLPLKKLNSDQQKYCQKQLTEKAPEMLKLLQSEDVKIQWTHEPIEVRTGNELRAVDAVTNPTQKQITLNLPRFLDMSTSDRVFLLSHEYFHLTKIEGKQVADDETVGPFQESDGGRQFLNAIGSSISVLEGYLPDVSSHRAMIARSRSWKRFWFDGNFGGSSAVTDPSSSFGQKDAHDAQLSFHFYLGDFALSARIKNEYNDKKILDNSVSISENVMLYGIGAGYRFFPFKDPLTFWGQSHILVQAFLDQIESHISVSDDFVSISDRTRTTGSSVYGTYYIPFFWGFWWHATVGYEYHPYKYSNVNLKYKDGRTVAGIGVSYAF